MVGRPVLLRVAKTAAQPDARAAARGHGSRQRWAIAARSPSTDLSLSRARRRDRRPRRRAGQRPGRTGRVHRRAARAGRGPIDDLRRGRRRRRRAPIARRGSPISPPTAARVGLSLQSADLGEHDGRPSAASSSAVRSSPSARRGGAPRELIQQFDVRGAEPNRRRRDRSRAATSRKCNSPAS